MVLSFQLFKTLPLLLVTTMINHIEKHGKKMMYCGFKGCAQMNTEKRLTVAKSNNSLPSAQLNVKRGDDIMLL